MKTTFYKGDLQFILHICTQKRILIPTLFICCVKNYNIFRKADVAVPYPSGKSEPKRL